MSQINRIVFIFPYRGVGGISLLFLRLAEYLVASNSYEIFVVDYHDGYIAKNIKSNSIKIINYEDDQKVFLPLDAVLVFQSMTPWSIFPSLVFDNTHKFFFWNCHPYNLVPVLPGLRNFLYNHRKIHNLINSTILFSFKKRLQRFLYLLLEKKSIVFMDAVNLTTTEKYLDINISSKSYLPIPISSPSALPMPSNMELKKIRIAWVGRIADFKFHILYRSIERTSVAQPKLNIPIEFIIVGDGDYQNLLIEKVKCFTNIQVRFVNHVSTEKMDEFLLNNVDILMAMGTSALEGAKLGVPTVLLDFSYSAVPKNYRFKWLHQERGYNLGSPITKDYLSEDDNSLTHLLSSIITNRKVIAYETYSYYEKNHSMNVVASQFISYINQSNCFFQDILSKSILGKGITYRFFSKLRGSINK